MTSQPIRLSTNFTTFIPSLTFTDYEWFLYGAFATGVACQQGTLILPDTWFRPPLWDLLVLQLLRPDSSNLPCLYTTFFTSNTPWYFLNFAYIRSVSVKLGLLLDIGQLLHLFIKDGKTVLLVTMPISRS